MALIRFTYEDDDGNQVVATWSPEYGVTIAGHRTMRERLLVEVVGEVAAPVPVAPRGPVAPVVQLAVPEPEEDIPAACTVCGHRRHGEVQCEVRVRAAGGDPCGCYGDHLELR